MSASATQGGHNKEGKILSDTIQKCKQHSKKYITSERIFYVYYLRDASQLARVLAVVSLSVLPSVRLSVCTSRYSIETATHRITQTTPHDSLVTLVFDCQKFWQNSNGVTPDGDAKCRCVVLEGKCRCGSSTLVTFDAKRCQLSSVASLSY